MDEDPIRKLLREGEAPDARRRVLARIAALEERQKKDPVAYAYSQMFAFGFNGIWQAVACSLDVLADAPEQQDGAEVTITILLPTEDLARRVGAMLDEDARVDEAPNGARVDLEGERRLMRSIVNGRRLSVVSLAGKP